MSTCTLAMANRCGPDMLRRRSTARLEREDRCYGGTTSTYDTQVPYTGSVGDSYADPRRAPCVGSPVRMFKVRDTWTGLDSPERPTIESAAIDHARRMNAHYSTPRYVVMNVIILSNRKQA